MATLSTSSLPADNKEWLEKFMRFGFISKGVVYCLLGILAILTANGLGSEKASKEGAFRMIYDQPFGKVLLIVLAIGMLGYVTLRAFQCFKDTDNKDDSMKGLATRAGYGISALIYSGFAVYAVKMVLNNGQGGKGNGSREFIVSKVLELPAGKWIMITVALIIIGSGIYQITKGVTGSFMKKIALIRSNLDKTFKTAGRIGYISRGIVLGIIGYLLFQGALNANAGEAKGTEQAFSFIKNTFGITLMVIVAVGLIGYGVFMFVKAKYQRLNIDQD